MREIGLMGVLELNYVGLHPAKCHTVLIFCIRNCVEGLCGSADENLIFLAAPCLSRSNRHYRAPPFYLRQRGSS